MAQTQTQCDDLHDDAAQVAFTYMKITDNGFVAMTDEEASDLGFDEGSGVYARKDSAICRIMQQPFF